MVLDSAGRRANGLYSARMSVDSLWKVGRKRGWWTGVKGGDLWVLVAGMAVVGAVYERDPAAVTDGVTRRVVGGMRGEEWRDRIRKKGSGAGKGSTEEEGLGRRE